MTADGSGYFALGRALNGVTHASASVFGPALCTEAVDVVDDDQHFTDLELAQFDICPQCRDSLLEAPRLGAEHTRPRALIG